MFELNGKYNTAKIFTNLVENEAQKQIIDLCNMREFSGSKIRIMPDVHAGKGCTIGTTMTIKDSIVPNMVGVDIGCGMLWGKIETEHLDLYALHVAIEENVPSGFDVNKNAGKDLVDLQYLRCYKHLKNVDRIYKSVGTLGGGNHFIEIDKSEKDNSMYLIIHSGSRNLGKQVAEYYQDLAVKELREKNSKEIQDLIMSLKSAHKEKEISERVKDVLEKQTRSDCGILSGDSFYDYIHDMVLVQEFARINREEIMNEICKSAFIEVPEFTHTVHNYIDMDGMILRKGAVSAKEGERLLIPLNMRDGSLICVGKGNEDWNYSAPHGAGRLFSRSKAKELFSLDNFKESMKDVYSKTVSLSTIDECPMAYKPYGTILDKIDDTVSVVERIIPIFNYKG